MEKYKHIFWDLDHTLWDFEKNSVAALQEVYHHFDLPSMGIPSFEEFNINYHTHNDKYWERFRKGFITREVMRWKRMYATMLDYKIANEKLASELGEAYLQFLPQQTNVFAHAIDVLEYAEAKGYAQHIITNGFENTQIEKMTNTNMLRYFDVIITSEKAMSMKPHKDIFNYALLKTGANLNNSIMIGDALDVDVLGAVNVGMDAVWFNVHQHQKDGKRTFEIHSLDQLYKII
ncbi:MAG: YjjG family noncanonical pyrimidine nucleotidase [Chitinophagaceae bacterium]|nr:YjjG family noncanonical pyrimidine nucleotidase [Chitinophagaceae bacterium]